MFLFFYDGSYFAGKIDDVKIRYTYGKKDFGGMADAGGNLAASSTVTADSQQAGYEKEKAVDGISNSDSHRWVSTGNTPNHWIQLEWGSEKSIGNVKVWSGSMAYPGNQLDDYTVQYWDGGAWQTVAAVTDNPTDGSSGEYNDLVFAPVNTTRIRLNITDPSHGTDNYARVLEIMAF